MARSINNLAATEVKSLNKPGKHADGGGLYLQVSPSSSKSWLFGWQAAGKRTFMGLGAYPAVSLADARKKAEDCRKAVAAGLDPLKESRKEETPTFREAVARYLEDQRLDQWKNAKHRAQWKMTLGEAYTKSILDKRVDEIGMAEVVGVLKPVWTKKAETASRLRGRIENVLAFAEAQGWRPEGKNPAQWKNGLDAILTKPEKLKRGHHKALPYDDVPAFMAVLAGEIGVAARALEFAILTAARSGEVLGATWDEIDPQDMLWTIPASRMKSGKLHRVPLSAAVLSILDLMGQVREGEHVFPGQGRGKGKRADTPRPLSTTAMEMLLRRMDAKGRTTVHGFRSAFRDWAGDMTLHPREVAEQALAHVVKGVEGAYRRSDALGKRRELMDAWAAFVTGKVGDNVVQFARRDG